MIEVVDDAVNRRARGVDRDRMQHQPEDAVSVREPSQLLVRDVPRRVDDGAAAGMCDADWALVRLDALAEELLGGV